MEWYLKKATGDVFGPVTTAALRQWAAGGRIAPDDQVSTDQETWMPAVDLPDLGLDWMVEVSPAKTYGPFHLLALGDLIREGSVPAASPIVHRVTGERHVLHEALLLVVLEQNTRLAATAQELRLELEAAQTELDGLKSAPVIEPAIAAPAAVESAPPIQEPPPPAPPAVAEPPAEVAAPAVPVPPPAAVEQTPPTPVPPVVVTPPAVEATAPTTPVTPPAAAAVPTAPPPAAEATVPAVPVAFIAPPPLKNAEWKEMAGKRDQFEKETHRWKRLYADLQASAQKRENELNERIEHLRREDLTTHTQLEQAQIGLQKLQKTVKQISDATVFSSAGESAAAQRAALFDAYNELSRRCDTLMDQLNSKSVELEDLMQGQQRIKDEADQRVQTLEANLRKERDEADRARKRALLMEEDHLQLLRSFRDMNDRYIRLRQSSGHVSSAETPWPPPSEVAVKKDLPEL
ncbi:MAG: GYF domain-containing protein [Kiritimatiellaeota bacterium]|nr:GYF domain-containing protein [Kiritimatiellota bacterium]